MKDYVSKSVNNKNTNIHPLSNYLSYDRRSDQYQYYTSHFSFVVEPHSFREAIKDSRWTGVMKMEIQSLKDYETWEIVDLPPEKNVFGFKWVYKINFRLIER